jgi:uncharacterized membrane protein YqjE
VGVIARAARAASSLLLARAQFAAVELTQTGADALRWLLWALGATALLALTLIVATATIVLALWPWLGWWSLAFLTLACASASGYLFYRLRQALSMRPPLLVQTLAEFHKDREALFGQGAGAGPEQKR